MTKVPRRSANMNPWPTEMDTTLVFSLYYTGINAGASETNARFRSNSAYEPDIITTTNKPTGYQELINLYHTYRVIGYKARIVMQCREVFGCSYLIRNTNLDPTASTGQFIYAGEALSHSGILGAKGAPPTTINFNYNISTVVGRDIEKDDIFSADVSSNPNDITYLGINFKTFGSDAFTAATGVAVYLDLRMRVRFYERKSIDDAIPGVKTNGHEESYIMKNIKKD